MPTFNAGNIEATASVDRTQFLRDLREMRADADRLTSKPIEMKATLDTSEAKRKLAELKADLASTRNTMSIRATLDDTALKASLASLRTQLAGTRDIRMHVSLAGSAAAMSSLTALNELANRLDGRDITLRVNVHNAAANAALAATAARAAALGTMSPTISPRVNPNSSRQVRDLRKAWTDLTNAAPSLMQAILPLAPALIPIGIAALGATAGLLSMAAAGGGVALIFGGVLKFAIKGATEDAKAYDKAQQNVAKAEAAVAATKAGTQARTKAMKNLAAAQRELTAATRNYTPAERSFNSAMTGVKTAWHNLIHATAGDTLGPASVALKAVSANIGKLKPVLDAVRPVAMAMAEAFRRWMGGGGLTTFVNFLVTRGVPILRNLEGGIRNLLGVAGRGMRTFGQFGVAISQGFTQMTQSVSSWATGTNGGPGGFQRFMTVFQQVAPAVVNFLQQLATTTGHFGVAMAILGPLSLSVASYLLQIINAIPIPVLTVIVGLFLAYKDAVFLLRAGLVILRAAQVGWTAAVWLTNTALFASPITWIVVGIGLLVGAVVLIATKTTWFQTAWKYSWNFIKQIFGDVMVFLRGGMLRWLLLLTGPIGVMLLVAANWSKVWGFIKSTAAAVWGWLQSAFHAFVGFFVTVYQGFLSGIKTAWNAAWGWIKNLLATMWGQIQGVFRTATGVVSGVWRGFLGGLKTGAKTVWDGIMTAVRTFKDSFTSVFKDVVSAVGTIWDGLKKVLAVPINFLIQSVYKNGIKTIWDDTAGKIGLPKMPDAPAPLKFATGGPVPGVGVGDRVPALLTPGERVLSRDNVQAMGGHGVLDSMFGRQFGRTRNGVVHADFGWGSIVNAAKGIGSGISGAVKGIGSGISGAAHWGLDKVKNLAGDIVYDVAKPALNAFKSLIHHTAPQPNGIPIAATDTLVAKALSFLKTHQNAAKAAAAASAGAGGMYPSAGPISVFDGVKLDAITIAQLKKAFGFAGFHFGLSQGSYSSGVSASAGTHDGGGALDVAGVGSMSIAQQVAVVRGLREAGFAAWRRRPPAFVDHIHAELLGDPAASASAKAQWPDYFAHRNGLAGHGPDTDPIDVAAGWYGSSAPSTGGGSTSANFSLSSSIAQEQAYAKSLVGAGQIGSLINLWNGESGWNPNAVNPSSGAYGIPQSLGHGHPYNLGDWKAQIDWGVNYIRQSYGTPNAAYAAWSARSPHWYAKGTDGAAPGWAWVGEQGPELVNFGGGETVLPSHVSMQMGAQGMGGYASGTVATTIKSRLDAATRTVATRQSTANTLQNQYDQERLAAVYATSKKARDAAVAEGKLTAARLSAAKHLLAQAKQAEAQLTKDYAAVNKSQSAQASVFKTWLASQKASIASQMANVGNVRNNYLQTAQSGAPSLSGLNTFTAIAGAFKNAASTLVKVQNNVGVLSKRGVSGGLLDAILGMPPADALAYSNLLVSNDGANIAAADSAFAGYDTAAGKYATAGANLTTNYANLARAQAFLGNITIRTEYPAKLELKLPDGTYATATVKSLETKIDQRVQKILNNAKTSKG